VDENSIARLRQLHPWLTHLAYALHDRLALEDIDLHITQGLRSYEDQAALYAKGRTSPGPIVTNAPPGHSWHSFGLAFDCAPFDLAGSPDWDVNHPAWGRIVDVGKNLGLFSGTQFTSLCDTPHFQLTGRFGPSPTDEVRNIYTAGGLQAVWESANIQPASVVK